MMRLAWSSPAALAMAPLQDLLNLGHNCSSLREKIRRMLVRPWTFLSRHLLQRGTLEFLIRVRKADAQRPRSSALSHAR